MNHVLKEKWSDQFLFRKWSILVSRPFLECAKRKRAVNNCKGLRRKKYQEHELLFVGRKNGFSENQYGSFILTKNNRIDYFAEIDPPISGSRSDRYLFLFFFECGQQKNCCKQLWTASKKYYREMRLPFLAKRNLWSATCILFCSKTDPS